MYKAAIEYFGFPESEYEEVLEALQEQEYKYFQFEPIVRTMEEILSVEADLCKQFRVMSQLYDMDKTFPIKSYLNCQWCDYKTPCQMMDAGEDYKQILQLDYKHNDRYDVK